MTDAAQQGGPTRRHVVTGAAAGLAVTGALPLLAACGAGGGGSSADSSPPPAGTKLGPVSGIPVGGGQVFPHDKVVVTQPSQGVYKGFSAVCTHAGCLVDKVADGTITCPCHLSQFSVSDGSVQGGPAPKPLPEVKIKVKGGQATLA